MAEYMDELVISTMEPKADILEAVKARVSASTRASPTG